MTPNDLACELFFREVSLKDSDKKLRRLAARACVSADIFYGELMRYARAKQPQPPEPEPNAPETLVQSDG